MGLSRAGLKRLVASSARVAELERRVADLERDLDEQRRHQLRLAELADVVQELLVPLATRDEDRAQEAIDRFNRSL